MEHRCLLAQSSMFDTSQALAPDSFLGFWCLNPSGARMTTGSHSSPTEGRAGGCGRPRATQSTTLGSLISTPPAWAGADTGLSSTRHLSAVCPVFALGSFIDLGFSDWKISQRMSYLYPSMLPPRYVVLVATQCLLYGLKYNCNVEVFYRFQLKHFLNYHQD